MRKSAEVKRGEIQGKMRVNTVLKEEPSTKMWVGTEKMFCWKCTQYEGIRIWAYILPKAEYGDMFL